MVCVMWPLQNNRHKIRVLASMQDDLLWWNKFLPIFNGDRVINHDDHFCMQQLLMPALWGVGCLLEMTRCMSIGLKTIQVSEVPT